MVLSRLKHSFVLGGEAGGGGDAGGGRIVQAKGHRRMLREGEC